MHDRVITALAEATLTTDAQKRKDLLGHIQRATRRLREIGRHVAELNQGGSHA
jgi:hypothetical protein